MPNNALAAAVGVAPSTCLGRVRALRESGVIRGYHADIDPAALDRFCALGVLATKQASLGTVAFEMAQFANRASGALTPRLIEELKFTVGS